MFGLMLLAGLAHGADRDAMTPSPLEDSLRAAARPTGYVFPSGRQQFQTWGMNTLGPTAIGGNLIVASWRHWVSNVPPEWGGEFEGFGKRFAAASLTTAITETSQSLASALMRQDAVYYRSPQGGLGPRIRHAALMTFMARNARGDAVFSPAKSLAPFVGPLVTQATVYPDRYDFGTALTSGAYSLLLNAGINLAHEFILPTPPWRAPSPAPLVAGR